jgi:hypothetical protein
MKIKSFLLKINEEDLERIKKTSLLYNECRDIVNCIMLGIESYECDIDCYQIGEINE